MQHYSRSIEIVYTLEVLIFPFNLGLWASEICVPSVRLDCIFSPLSPFIFNKFSVAFNFFFHADIVNVENPVTELAICFSQFLVLRLYLCHSTS